MDQSRRPISPKYVKPGRGQFPSYGSSVDGKGKNKPLSKALSVSELRAWQTEKSQDNTANSGNTKNISVIVRTRPPTAKERQEPRALHVRDGRTIRLSRSAIEFEGSYDHVRDENASQKDIFDLVRDNVEAVVKESRNTTIFAYGPTGTGKTYTILGSDDVTSARETAGLIPRSVGLLFQMMRKLKSADVSFVACCSYLEIYNDKVFDLLCVGANRDRKPLELRDDRVQGVYVQDLTEWETVSVDDVAMLLKLGAETRSVGQTDVNERSSRSHTLFQVFVEKHAPGSVTRSKLNIVDLAGSEKWKTSVKLPPQRIAELTHINKSLSALANCVSALSQPGRAHVPFRDSKLTRMLQDSLGGNSRTVFIATVSPALSAYEETTRTLKFADRAKRVTTTTVTVETPVGDFRELLKQREAEIRRLQAKVVEREAQIAKLAKIASLAGNVTPGDPDGGALSTELAKLRDENESLQDEIMRLRQAMQVSGRESPGTPSTIASRDEQVSSKSKHLEGAMEELRLRQKELDDYLATLSAVSVYVDDVGGPGLPSDSRVQLLEAKATRFKQEADRQRREKERVADEMRLSLDQRQQELRQAETIIQTLRSQLEKKSSGKPSELMSSDDGLPSCSRPASGATSPSARSMTRGFEDDFTISTAITPTSSVSGFPNSLSGVRASLGQQQTTPSSGPSQDPTSLPVFSYASETAAVTAALEAADISRGTLPTSKSIPAVSASSTGDNIDTAAGANSFAGETGAEEVVSQRRGSGYTSNSQQQLYRRASGNSMSSEHDADRPYANNTSSGAAPDYLPGSVLPSDGSEHVANGNAQSNGQYLGRSTNSGAHHPPTQPRHPPYSDGSNEPALSRNDGYPPYQHDQATNVYNPGNHGNSGGQSDTGVEASASGSVWGSVGQDPIAPHSTGASASTAPKPRRRSFMSMLQDSKANTTPSSSAPATTVAVSATTLSSTPTSIATGTLQPTSTTTAVPTSAPWQGQLQSSTTPQSFSSAAADLTAFGSNPNGAGLRTRHMSMMAPRMNSLVSDGEAPRRRQSLVSLSQPGNAQAYSYGNAHAPAHRPGPQPTTTAQINSTMTSTYPHTQTSTAQINSTMTSSTQPHTHTQTSVSAAGARSAYGPPPEFRVPPAVTTPDASATRNYQQQASTPNASYNYNSNNYNTRAHALPTPPMQHSVQGPDGGVSGHTSSFDGMRAPPTPSGLPQDRSVPHRTATLDAHLHAGSSASGSQHSPYHAAQNGFVPASVPGYAAQGVGNVHAAYASTTAPSASISSSSLTDSLPTHAHVGAPGAAATSAANLYSSNRNSQFVQFPHDGGMGYPAQLPKTIPTGHRVNGDVGAGGAAAAADVANGGSQWGVAAQRRMTVATPANVFHSEVSQSMQSITKIREARARQKSMVSSRILSGSTFG